MLKRHKTVIYMHFFWLFIGAANLALNLNIMLKMKLILISDWSPHRHHCEAANTEDVTAVQKRTTLSSW